MTADSGTIAAPGAGWEPSREPVRTAGTTGRGVLAAAMAVAPAAMLLVRFRDGLVREANVPTARLFGRDRAEILDRPIGELGLTLASMTAEDRVGLTGRLRAEGHAGPVELTLRRPDGRPLVVEASATVLDVAGERCVFAVLHDVTGRCRSQPERGTERALAQRAADLELLAGFQRDLLVAREPTELRRLLCEHALRLADCHVVLLLELDGRGALVQRAVAGVAPAKPVIVLPNAGGSSSARVVLGRRPGFVADVVGLDLPRQRVAAGIGARSGFFAPVLRGTEPLGVLVVGWARPRVAPPTRVAKLLPVLAGEAGAALERVESLERASSLALTDPLTGLPNRRHWEQTLPTEAAAAARHGRPLSVGMLDLDGFKVYNDLHGHHAGDDLLRVAAHAWRGAMRPADLLARFGGDEFAVLLRDTGLPEARVALARLAEVTPAPVTVSMGVAEWDGAEPIDEVLRRADRALYVGKAARRPGP